MNQDMQFRSSKMSMADLSKAGTIPALPQVVRKVAEQPSSRQAEEPADRAPIQVVHAQRQPIPTLVPKQYGLAAEFALEGVDPKYMISGFEPGHPFAPVADPDYVFKRSDLRDMLAFWDDGLTALKFEGDPSTGKSSIVFEFHARLRWPLYVHSATEDTDTRQIFGQLLPDESGNLRWVDGPALRAAREGTSFLMDEWNLLNPNIGSSLNLLAEGKPYYVPETGEVVKPKKGFRLFATENPVDSRLLVAGRNVQDVASDDRFMIIKTNYMAEADEIVVVKKAVMRANVAQTPDQAELVAKQVVGIANKVRTSFRGGDAAIDRPMSTRTCIRWARLIFRFKHIKQEEGGPAIYALHRAMRMSTVMAAAVEGYTRAAIGTT